jgi:hypothetical protein
VHADRQPCQGSSARRFRNAHDASSSTSVYFGTEACIRSRAMLGRHARTHRHEAHMFDQMKIILRIRARATVGGLRRARKSPEPNPGRAGTPGPKPKPRISHGVPCVLFLVPDPPRCPERGRRTFVQVRSLVGGSVFSPHAESRTFYRPPPRTRSAGRPRAFAAGPRDDPRSRAYILARAKKVVWFDDVVRTSPPILPPVCLRPAITKISGHSFCSWRTHKLAELSDITVVSSMGPCSSVGLRIHRQPRGVEISSG